MHSIDIPPTMLVFVPGLGYPDSEVKAELGISHLRSYVTYLEHGPGNQAGWIMSREHFEPSLTDWLPIAGVWIGVIRNEPTQPTIAKSSRPVKRRRREKSSRALADLYSIIESELREEILLSLQAA